MKTRIDIIRHGEPVGGRRYRGHGVDDSLTDIRNSQQRPFPASCEQSERLFRNQLMQAITAIFARQ